MLFKKITFREKRRLIELPPSAITPSPFQPRREFDYYELMELAESIRENGLLQPVTVRKTETGYQLISGERRLRASIIANMKTIPCFLIEADNRQSSLFALLENIQRADLTCFEEAEGLQKLISDFGLSQSEVAMSMGMAQSTLSNKLRLLRLNGEERKRVMSAGLTERHARALVRVSGKQRSEAIDIMIAKQLTAGEAEMLIDDMLAPKTSPKKPVRHKAIADMRILTNSVTRMVESLKKSGFNAKSVKSETDEFIEYKITVPKNVIKYAEKKV